jgi:hypothetical protein
VNAFDPDAYRKAVLAPLVALPPAGGPGVSPSGAAAAAASADPFRLFGLDPSVDDTAVIAERIEAVVAFWQKERNNPKYRSLVETLLTRRSDLAGELLDPGRRALLRERVRAEDAASAGSDPGPGLFDAAVARLAQRAGGIPAGKRERLTELGRAAGLTGPEVDRRLASHPVAADPPARRLPGFVYDQIRRGLDDIGRLTGQPPPASLYELIGCGPDDPPEDLAAACSEYSAQNRERRADRLRSVVDDLLALVLTHLLGADPSLYREALAREAADRLRPDVTLAVLVEDELTPADRDYLIEAAAGHGLDEWRAAYVVDRLAWEAGDPNWWRSDPSEPAADQPRPSGGRAPRGSPAPPTPDRRVVRQAIDAARSALEAGLPLAAAGHAEAARAVSDSSAVLALAADVEAALAGAHALWTEAERAMAGRRFVAAQSVLTRLARTARDVPGSEGRPPASMLAFAAGRVAAAQKLLARLDHAPTADTGAILAEVLDLCADLPAAVELGRH